MKVCLACESYHFCLKLSVACKQSRHQHVCDPARNQLFDLFANKLIQDKSHPLSLRSFGARGAGSTWASGGPKAKSPTIKELSLSETSFAVRRLRPALHQVEQLKKGVPRPCSVWGKFFSMKFKAELNQGPLMRFSSLLVRIDMVEIYNKKEVVEWTKFLRL